MEMMVYTSGKERGGKELERKGTCDFTVQWLWTARVRCAGHLLAVMMSVLSDGI